jgi:hypothetical protein
MAAEWMVRKKEIEHRDLRMILSVVDCFWKP